MAIELFRHIGQQLGQTVKVSCLKDSPSMSAHKPQNQSNHRIFADHDLDRPCHETRRKEYIRGSINDPRVG